ncbi:putative Rho-GTPase-activating protein 7 [Lasiodiplodia hormozganensis]|uniref:Rho-GTPase-activating protein 7 n=1 Tax=Lasiodiplodia hormozganensis TaxID=869390 RepID=A0AA39YZR9_9PEZI|nr:putative Rho-GTPase-activating protein 7 [Lasiodiplodia hormozganensis]
MDSKEHLPSPADRPHTPLQEGPSTPNDVEPAPAVQPSLVDQAIQREVDEVIYSDIGVNTLLTRLKQSIASARDFSNFLGKRSKLEEEQAQGVKKLCRSTHEALRRNESRQGTYGTQFEEATKVHERMADNGMQFALSLHQMHEDLNELTNTIERQRKHWKQTALASEKKVTDAIQQMEKARAKYESLAEDYDKVKTGDKSAGRMFGIKGPKSAAQHEEDIHRKLQAADADYKSKVENAQLLRTELVEKLRPQGVRAMMELIKECDSGLTLQMQKFASFNEKLLLGNGILVAPLNNPGEPEHPSLRDIIYKIDNDKDLTSYITEHSVKVPRPPEIKYQQHSTLAPAHQPTPPSVPVSDPFRPSQPSPVNTQPPPPPQQEQPPFLSYNPPRDPSPILSPVQDGLRQNPYSAPTESHPPYPTSDFPPQSSGFSNGGPPGGGPYGAPPPSGPPTHFSNAPPIKPVFGVTLDELFHRDGTPVPLVVSQCIQAVELFGLETEGIYRVPGTNSHIMSMKQLFDHDSTAVDFRNPETFYHDVNSVAGLLKQFFRDLPDPLLTAAHYEEFIEAAKIEDDTVRRDSLHAIINALPDPNYATLRALVLHLNHVQERSASNRMSTTNLAICFAPTVMGQHRGAMADAGLQAKVLDTILVNTYQIFDED